MPICFLRPLGRILRSRLATALASTFSAAAVAVVINVWTESWAWPVGISLAVLILTQALFERTRGGAGGGLLTSSSNASRRRVEQRFADITDSKITAVRCTASGGDVEVVQRLGAVDRSTVIGVYDNGSR